jgi:hypothetical protein
VTEEREWRNARTTIDSDLALLRPAWLPAEFRDSGECGSPWVLVGPGATLSGPSYSSYKADYRGRRLPDGSCSWLSFYGQLGSQDDGGQPFHSIETDTFDARGTTVHVERGVPRTDPRDPPPPFVVHLWWNEPGTLYDVLSNVPGLDLADVSRIVRSLEAMR